MIKFGMECPFYEQCFAEFEISNKFCDTDEFIFCVLYHTFKNMLENNEVLEDDSD